VKVESSLELPVLDDRPSSTTDRVHFVIPFPGKCQACCLLVGFDTIINLSMDGAKLKLAQVVLSEGDIAWHHEVDVVLILLLHLDNPPRANIPVAHGVLLDHRLHQPSVTRRVCAFLVQWYNHTLPQRQP
jgi:hypothetical protein